VSEKVWEMSESRNFGIEDYSNDDFIHRLNNRNMRSCLNQTF